MADQALDALVNALYDLEPCRQRLEALGGLPSYAQFIALGERPILAALADTVFEGRIGRILAPNERTTFAKLGASWTRQHDAAAALGEQTDETPEAA
jgi:hypothetical protein